MMTERLTPPPFEEIRRRIVARQANLTRLGATFVGVFGSCARHEQRAGSDIDLAVDLRPGFGYFDLAEMEALLNDDFDVEVRLDDLGGMTKGHEHIRREMVRIF